MIEYVDVTVRLKVKVQSGGKRACRRVARELVEGDYRCRGADSIIGEYSAEKVGKVKVGIVDNYEQRLAKRCFEGSM